MFAYNSFSDTAVDVEIISKTKKVSLIFVGQKKGLSESSFGHVALRLSHDETPSITDATIEFVADIPETDTGIGKYIKGTGIFSAYTVGANIIPFFEFKKIKQLQEDRDMTVVELDLTLAQIEKVKEYLINFKESPESPEYTFLKQNCSFFAVASIEHAIGEKLKHKSLPWTVVKGLKTSNLVKGETEYIRASQKRVEYAQRYLELGLEEAFKNSNWSKNFVENFEHKDLYVRLNSYFKALSVLTDKNTDSSVKRKVKSLVRYLKQYETAMYSSTIRTFFENPESKTVLSPTPHSFLKAPSSMKRLKHEFIIKNNKVYVELKWRASISRRGRSTTKHFTKQVLVPELKYNTSNNAISYNDHQVGVFVKTKKEKFILSQKLEYGIDFNKKTKRINILVYVDYSKETVSKKMTTQEFKAKGILPLNNAKDFASSGGTCFAMVLLQKALLERTIYIPENDAIELDKIEILKRLFLGEYVVIPGYKNISEFTADIDKEKLKTLVLELQSSLEKHKMLQVMENVQHLTEIKSKYISTVKGLVSEGVLVPMVIAMLKKDTRKTVSNIGHVVLIQNIKEIEDGAYQLTVYDPNTNINSLLKMNKDFKLEYPFYNSEYDYIGGFKIIDSTPVQIDHAVRSKFFRSNDLRGRTVNGSPLFLSPQLLITVLE